MASLRLTPIRAFLPTKAKGGHVDLLVDDACCIKEFREKVVLESRRTALSKDNFVIAGDSEGKLVFLEDRRALLDPKHEIPFDLGSGKLQVWVRLTQPADVLNTYVQKSAARSKDRRDIPLPEDVPSLPPKDPERLVAAANKESLYHAFKKSRSSAPRPRDQEFEVHEKHLRELLAYAETLRRQLLAFEDALRTVCTDCKTITDTLAQRLSNDDREHSYTRMIMQAENVASEEMGAGKAAALTGMLRDRLVAGCDELVQDLAARVDKVGRRLHLWREACYYQAKVLDLGKRQSTPKLLEKQARNQGKMQAAQEAFEAYNAELLEELKELWNQRHELLGPLLSDWIELQQSLFVGMARAIRRVPTEPNVAVAEVSDTEDEEEEEEDGASGNPFAAPGASSPPSGSRREPVVRRSANPFDAAAAPQRSASASASSSSYSSEPLGSPRIKPAGYAGANPFDDDAADDDHDDDACDQPLPQPAKAPESRHRPAARSVGSNPFGDDDDSDGSQKPAPARPHHRPSARSASSNPFAEEEEPHADRYQDEDIRVLFDEVDSDDDDGDTDDDDPGNPFRVLELPRPVSAASSPKVSPGVSPRSAAAPARRPLPAGPNPNRRQPPHPSQLQSLAAAAAASPDKLPSRPPKPPMSPRRPPPSTPPAKQSSNPFA